MKIKEQSFLIFAVVFSCVAEIANGLLIQAGVSASGVVGYVYRSLLLFFCLMICLKSNRKMKIFLTCAFAILLDMFIHIFFFKGSLDEVIVDAKYLLLPGMILASEILFKRNKLNEIIIEKIIVYSGVICVLAFFIGRVLDIGINTYEGTVGYRGLFNSVNTVTFVLICLIFSTFIFAEKKRSIKLYLLILCELSCLILIGTKSGIVFSFGLILIYWIILRWNKCNWTKVSLKKILILFVIFVGILGFLNFYSDQLNLILMRQQEFLRRSDSAFSYLVSGRNVTLMSALDYYNRSFSPLSFIFGIGPNMLIQNAGKSIEMDFFEYLISWGIIGVCITYGLTLWYVLKTKERDYCGKQKAVLWLIYGFITVYSVLGGHVYGEPFSEVYFVVVLNIPICMNGTYIDKVRK